MSRRYSFDSDPGENAPLDDPNDPYSQRQAHSNHSNHYLRHHQQQPPLSPSSLESQPPFYQDNNSVPPSSEQYHNSTHPSPTRAGPPSHPSAHPDSAFNRLRQNRRYSGGAQRAAAGAGIGAGAAVGALPGREVYDVVESSSSRPIPPPHRENSVSTWGHRVPQTNVTPGADNFSDAAVGGMSGLAMSVAERNARESGLEAMRQPQQYQQSYQDAPPQHHTYDDPRGAYGNDRGYDMSPGYGPNSHGPPAQGYNSSPSLAPMGAAALTHSGRGTPTRSVHSYSSDPFRDPHMAYGQRMDPYLGQFNPNDIDDDGDDGLEYRRSARNSILSLGGSTNRGNAAPAGAAGVAGAAAAGGVMGGLMGRNRNSAVNYDPVQNTSAAGNLGAAGGYEMGAKTEKQSEWLSGQKSSRKKWKWFILILVGLAIAGGIAGGVVGGILSNKKSGSSSGGGADGVQSADSDSAKNGDLGIDSDEIRALMNNPNLHKVFPGVDYTPINVQFPDCLKNPPSQNNVTRDVAVLSQLTNTIRLYGTDCNQTEMTIHALKQLKLENDIKIWLGVWQDGNDTTNKRQLSRMWNILDEYGAEPFKGLIIGNEILFRKQMTTTQLSNLLDSVRSNLTTHDWNLPVATSDLGDNWDSQLAQISDYIMGNIHPFFAGVNAKEAASWTWSFWENKANSFFKADNEKNVISEIGWPTQGGTDCGDASVTDCPNGSVAGIDELNTLMEGWVCQALANGTNYFWFEMFDEPWKISFDTPGKEWEDQWGLMDVNRNLKEGVKIPDCGGKTV
ncbi:glycoside hydrolase family 17 protein [Annulohypoxylon bovei var. microspora]|nr:glycoside hydrolase family 17 protein [Annulohypoxylon bovei var. microspora]